MRTWLGICGAFMTAILLVACSQTTPESSLNQSQTESNGNTGPPPPPENTIPVEPIETESKLPEPAEIELEEHSEILATIEKLGGYAVINEQHARQPIVFVNLQKTKVVDQDLSALIELSHLRRLYLNDTHISDRAVPHLKKLTQLKSLHIRGTRITQESIDQLKQALPDVNIFH